MSEHIYGQPAAASLNLRLADEGRTWLDQRHPDYRENVIKWRIARDHYTGNVLSGGPGDLPGANPYLVRKATAESEPAYLERVALADYTPHFSTAVDALAGMLFAVEGDAIRFLGDDERPGLGEPDDPETPMHRLWRNVDGQGTGWLTLFKQLAIELIVAHRAWIVISKSAREEAVAQVWPATSVVNWWFDETGRLAQALLVEHVDQRTDIRDSAKRIGKRWMLYTLEGWETWEKDGKGEPRRIGGEAYAKPFVDRNGEPTLPIFPVELPLRRNLGWLMAMKANAIFNKESERDHLLRTACFPLLLIVGTDKHFKEAIADIKRGVRALRVDPKANPHSFIAPPGEPASILTEVIKRKVEEFYVTFFREYGDAGREKTATETRQDVAAGVGAFLQMLKAAVDDAENRTLARVAQVELPDDEDAWFINRVERTETFVPTDVQAVIESVKQRYVAPDQPMPLGPSGLLNIVKQVAQYDGVEIEDGEAKAAIMMAEYRRQLDLFDKLPVPAEIKVEMALRLVVSLGLVDPEETEKLEDGSEKRKIDALREEMLDLALADDEARKHMAQPLDLGPPASNGGEPPAPRKKVKEIERTPSGFRMTETGGE